MIDTAPAPVTVPMEPTTPIKPSEAIRLGCLTTAPVTGVLFDTDGKACALGALMVGYGYGEDDADGDYTVAVRLLPGPAVPCPEKDCSGHYGIEGIADLVIRLNDNHRWSRERIADWLASEHGL